MRLTEGPAGLEQAAGTVRRPNAASEPTLESAEWRKKHKPRLASLASAICLKRESHNQHSQSQNVTERLVSPPPSNNGSAARTVMLCARSRPRVVAVKLGIRKSTKGGQFMIRGV